MFLLSSRLFPHWQLLQSGARYFEEYLQEPDRDVSRCYVDIQAILTRRQKMRKQIFTIRQSDNRHIPNKWALPLQIRRIRIYVRHKHMQHFPRIDSILKIAIILGDIDEKFLVDEIAVMQCHANVNSFDGFY